ncbi:MAG: patatin-like phospholipase family protein [Bacteroidia bacterium]
MKDSYKAIFHLLVIMIGFSANAQSPRNKVLVVSGGGARGAWGVGVVEHLLQTTGDYNAVFGTSTGSLTAPLTLLPKDTAKMVFTYTHVTKDSIFNVDPFNTTETYTNGVPTVTTSMRAGNAIFRLLFGKESLGESKPLRNLIHHNLTQSRYDSIKNYYHVHLNVAVTNMVSGHAEIKSSDECNYNDMCDWIWASADEPIWMSYLHKDDSVYSDGGVIEVIPVVEGLNYAFQKGMDTVDVVINNSPQGVDNNWSVKGSWLNGLERVVDVMPTSISNDDMAIGVLMTQLHDAQGEHRSKNDGFASGKKDDGHSNHLVVLRVYSMPDSIAVHYRDELGFFQDAMTILLNDGRHNTPAPEVYSIDYNSFIKSAEYVRKQLNYRMKRYK